MTILVFICYVMMRYKTFDKVNSAVAFGIFAAKPTKITYWTVLLSTCQQNYDKQIGRIIRTFIGSSLFEQHYHQYHSDDEKNNGDH